MLLGFTYNDILLYLLLFVRVFTALTVFPILGSNNVPIQVKIYTGLVLAILLYNSVGTTAPLGEWSIMLFVFNVGKEVLIGLLLGFIPTVMFAAIELAGHLISMQMGLAIVNVYNPQTQTQASVIGQFQVFIASMIFLAIDGHHLFLEGLFQSYQVVPIIMLKLQAGLYDFSMAMATQLFISAIKIGAPVVITLLLTSVALGLVARAVPQMNVFIVGMPLKIGVGFIIIAVSLPIFGYVFNHMIKHFEQDMITVLRLLRV